MTSKRELQIAYGMAIILFVVGFISYAAFSAKSPEQPLRLMFKCKAGKVFFDHQTHLSDMGYGLACRDCHHNLEEGETEGVSPCGDCHEVDSDDEDIVKRMDAFHNQCIGCHKDFEAGPGSGPEECSLCHVL